MRSPLSLVTTTTTTTTTTTALDNNTNLDQSSLIIDQQEEQQQQQPVVNNNQQSTTKRPKSTYPFGKCRVCSDKATGVHYGVASCEGCKGFFKRMTLRKQKYRCFFGNNCPLMPDNRNRCKACRFRRCLEAGMSIDGVKMGRIPKAEKERALLNESLKHQQQQPQNTSIENSENNNNHHYSISSSPSTRSSSPASSPNVLNELNLPKYINTPPLAPPPQAVAPSPTTDIIKFQHYQYKEKDAAMSHCHLNSNVSTLISTSCSKYNNNDASVSAAPSIYRQQQQQEHYNNNRSDNNSQVTVYNNKEENNFRKIKLKYQLSSSSASSSSSTDNSRMHHHHQYHATPSVGAFRRVASNNNESIMRYLIDEVNELHWINNKRVFSLEQQANLMVSMGRLYIDHNDANIPIEFTWSGLVDSIPIEVKTMISFMKELPGIKEISTSSDFALLVNKRLFDNFLLKYASVHVKGQSYAVLPNGIQYTRDRMEKVIGKEMCEAIFEFSEELNGLGLTMKEKALLFPLTFTAHDDALTTSQRISILHTDFMKALVYELCSNKRDAQFFTKLCQLLSILPKLNELQMKNIRALRPTTSNK